MLVKKYAVWGSALAPNGYLYYFNRESQKVQWNRPEDIEKDIMSGKLAKDQTEPWHECEFLHISFQQCEKSNLAESGCLLQQQRFMRCMRQRLYVANFAPWY